VINNPGQITGGPNSVINNPGKCSGGKTPSSTTLASSYRASKHLDHRAHRSGINAAPASPDRSSARYATREPRFRSAQKRAAGNSCPYQKQSKRLLCYGTSRGERSLRTCPRNPKKDFLCLTAAR